MERETKKITTPCGAVVELYTYLTGGETRELQKILLKGRKVDEMQGGKLDMSTMGVETMLEVQDLMLTLLAVSLNGEKKDVYKNILNLRSEDVDFVLTDIGNSVKELEEKKT
jgi:hypothetical protein